MGRIFEVRKSSMFARWDKMAKNFTRIGKEIAIAVKASGPDPDNNPALRRCYLNAKACNMPKDRVEAAIKRAVSKDTTNYEEMVYEGYAQHGIAVLVECTTDNTNRSIANIRSSFTRCGGTVGTSGMLDFVFDRKSVFKIANNGKTDIEELEFELIDFGAEEVFLDEETNQINIYGEFTAFGTLQKYLEEKGIEILNSDFERVPTDTKTLTEEEAADVEKLIERLEDDDDVQMVYHNMVIS